MDLAVVEHTKAAITALSNPEETNRANEWLVEFEKSTAAWQVADHLVREGTGSFRFFGAKFLYSKIQRQYFQLDASSANMLTQSLVQNILRFAQEPQVEFNVCRYLCLALAALALQMNQAGIVNQILGWMNPIISASPKVLLELLIVLPEEAYNRQIDVPHGTRTLFVQQLSSSAVDVLTFLSTLWENSSEDTKCRILKCTERWIDTTTVTVDMVVTHPMYQKIIETLNSQEVELFEYAVDVVSVILQRFQCLDRRIQDTCIPAIMSLRPKWANSVSALAREAAATNVVDADDLDQDTVNCCRAMCRIFTEVAEACMDMYVSSQMSKVAGLGEMVDQLLECCRFPYSLNISQIPLKFFYDLSMMAKLVLEMDGSSIPDSTSANNGSTKNALNTQYSPVFHILLEIAATHMVLTDMNMLSGRISISDHMLDVRAEWKETVLDCCYVLGGVRSMELLCRHLQTAAASSASNNGSVSADANWGRVESLLLCMTVATSFVSRQEQTLVPQVLNFVVASIPANIQVLRNTTTNLLGRYAFWLESNHNFIKPVLDRLFQDLVLGGASAIAAAKAIMGIYRACSGLSSLPVEQLHNVTLQLRSTQHETNMSAVSSSYDTRTAFDAELLLLEGLSVAASQLSPIDSENMFKMAILPIVGMLNQELQAPAPDAFRLAQQIDRLTVLLQFYKLDAPFVAELFISLLPLFQRGLDICPTEKICEKLCRCYKHTMRTQNNRFLPFLPTMTTHLAEQFNKTPFPAFLYGGSTCISTFSLLSQGKNDDVLYTMLWSMSNTFFIRFSSLQQFQEHPDVVEEYFFLMAKALQYCPRPFVFATAESATVVAAGISGLALQHREAQKGILLFFERFVQLPSFWKENQENTAIIASAKQMVHVHAPALLRGVFTMLSGEMPAYALDESNGCISDVLWCLKRRCGDDFKVWVHAVIPTLSTVAQQVAERLDVVSSIFEAKSQKEFSAALDRFELTCRRSV